MKLREHTIISALSGGAIYFISESPALAASTALAGIFIDLDHFCDYFKNVAIKIDIKDFFYKCENCEMQKVYIPLHSYEFILILTVLNYFHSTQISLGILIGSTIHLIADFLYNRTHFFSYSFVYRYIKKFRREDFFKSPYGRNKNS